MSVRRTSLGMMALIPIITVREAVTRQLLVGEADATQLITRPRAGLRCRAHVTNAAGRQL